MTLFGGCSEFKKKSRRVGLADFTGGGSSTMKLKRSRLSITIRSCNLVNTISSLEKQRNVILCMRKSYCYPIEVQLCVHRDHMIDAATNLSNLRHGNPCKNQH